MKDVESPENGLEGKSNLIKLMWELAKWFFTIYVNSIVIRTDVVRIFITAI